MLKADGTAREGEAQELITTTRMVHSYVLGKIAGMPGCDAIIDAGMQALWNNHRDTEHGGYLWSFDENGPVVTDKLAYGHMFVLLAASSAKAIGHPDADRLRVCQVDTDEGVKQIICGAPNARKGITVVVAKPGVYVPGIDTTIGVGKIRGIESFGMMASESEMELSDEHDGIIELENGEVGQSFVDWLAANDPAKVDPVIEIAITPNRPDALGVRGIARDLAARGLGKLKPVEEIEVDGTFSCPVSVTIDEDTTDQCPVFFGRVIRGVTNGPSPQWLQDRLRAIGLRPISFLVDVTNFFTFDQNRPLHVFDADKIAGNALRIHKAKGGETITALDEKEYTMVEGMTVISDDNGIESIGGRPGGERPQNTQATVPPQSSTPTITLPLESSFQIKKVRIYRVIIRF